MFIVLLTDIGSVSNHKKPVLLNNKKCKIQPTLTNLHPNEYSQELYYYPFAIKLDDVLEVVIFLMTYQIKYVFQIKQKI